ncbi:hypothetical protein [Streptomyces vinaceus]|uniref:hypothetical protein n=1 Tax=Streptomyces vinaceus TaxID=1960 RepID=UPI00369A4240
MLLAAAAPAVALTVVLAVVLWPGGPSGEPDVAGGGSPADARSHGAFAAQELDKLPGVTLSAAYVLRSGQTQTRADITVTAEGKATGTLESPVSGKAAMAWSGDQLYLKGDDDFWAQQGPQYGHDLTSSGHWIAPKKQSGYYMLDSFAVNAGSLTPKSLAEVVRQITSDPSMVQEDAGTQDGRRATSYTAAGGTVILASDAPYAVLAIGISPAPSAVPGSIRAAAWRPSAGPPVRSPGRRVLPVAYGDEDDIHNPYLTMVPKPATEKQVADVRTAAQEAAAAAAPPASSAEAAEVQGPSFTIRANSPDLCTSTPCSYSFTVTNELDEPAEAVLHVSFPGIPDRAHPLGTLAAKESREVSGTRPNAAKGTGTTVRHTDAAWVYSPATYGPDPQVAERLRARGLKPDDVFVARGLRPVAAKLLDLFTQGISIDDAEANRNAVEVLRTANTEGQLPMLAAIADSGSVSNLKDLAAHVEKANKMDNPGDVRVLQQVAHLARNNPNVQIVYDGTFEVDGKKYKADYIVTSRDGGASIKKSFQVKTGTSRRNFSANVEQGAQQLNGEGGVNAVDNLRENSPPGFRRILQLYVEPNLTELFTKTKGDLESAFFETRKWAKVRESLCKQRGDGTGPRVEELVVVNGAGIHVWDSLGELCEGRPRPGSGTLAP